MNCTVCGRPIEEGRTRDNPPSEAKYCSKCRSERRRRAKLKYTWRPEYDAFLKAQYFGGLNRRFRVLNRMVRMTGLPRWHLKRQAARLGLTMKMDRKPWTQAELTVLDKLVGRVSSAMIAKRLHRPESSVVNKLKRLGNSRRVRESYTMRDLEQYLGKITTRSQAGLRTVCFAIGFKPRTATMAMGGTATLSSRIPAQIPPKGVAVIDSFRVASQPSVRAKSVFSRTIARKCLILVPTMSRELRRFCVAIATSGPPFFSLEI